MYEQKYAQLAGSEVDFPTYGDFNDPENIAFCKLSGYIEQRLIENTKEGYIKAGLDFLDTFDEGIETRLGDIQNNAPYFDDPKEEEAWKAQQVAFLNKFQTEVCQVDRAEFARVLGEDWDEQHEVESEE
jgi:hypothetical protein